ncbi:surface anchored protein [Streptococcus pneumoniae]|nr:surface anchored protein [Streptococcus pneumoniae]
MSLQIKLKKLAKELSKLLKDSNLETVDKDVLENSQKELQKAVLFLADEKGSEHTEAEVIDNLKEVIAKLKQTPNNILKISRLGTIAEFPSLEIFQYTPLLDAYNRVTPSLG